MTHSIMFAFVIVHERVGVRFLQSLGLKPLNDYKIILLIQGFDFYLLLASIKYYLLIIYIHIPEKLLLYFYFKKHSTNLNLIDTIKLKSYCPRIKPFLIMYEHGSPNIFVSMLILLH